jgi:hypothetical protein
MNAPPLPSPKIVTIAKVCICVRARSRPSCRADLFTDVEYLRYRRSEPEHNNQLPLAEEGRLSAASTLTSPSAPLSRARFYVVISLLIAIVLTFALSAFAAHHTGKMRMACTKGIIFSASVLMSCFTVFAMIVARYTLQTALTAGLLEFLVGFGLVVEVHDFMA